MSKKRTSTISKVKTDWGKFDALTDEQVRAGIDADPDVNPTDVDFWKTARKVFVRCQVANSTDGTEKLTFKDGRRLHNECVLARIEA